MAQFHYFMDRNPVVLPVRTVQFICAVCKKPGWGAPNAVTHDGECRRQHARNRAKRSAELRKARQKAERC